MVLFLRRVLFFYFGTTLDYSIGGGDTIVIDTIEDSREHAEKTYEVCGGLSNERRQSTCQLSAQPK